MSNPNPNQITSMPAGPSIQSAWPAQKNIIELFEDQVANTPGYAALVYEAQQLSYTALNAKANQLAYYLLSKGVKHESLVAVCMERSVEMMIAILAILKTGAAYVPIDPTYPGERIGYMLQDTAAPLVVSTSTISKNLPVLSAHHVINLDDECLLIAKQPTGNPAISFAPETLAYIIYTSGSTGVPKGVMVQHNNVVSLVKGISYVKLNSQNILLSTGSSSFDATTFEYWGMLLNGGQLILCPENTLTDTALLKAEIRSHSTTMMWFTAGWLNQLTETDITIFEGLKTILAGGEKLSEKHIEKICYRI